MISFEELEIHTGDRIVLRARVGEPKELRATLVLAHAMFARKSSFGRPDRPGLADALATRGYRTVAFDFRGHGDSAKPEWGYDDLVRFDLPAVVDGVRARSEGKPVVIVGHSLGANVALAAQATKRIAADEIVALGANLWMRELEGSTTRWAAKLALAHATRLLARKGIPARRLRMGSDDAPRAYLEDLLGYVVDGSWKSAAGEDYLAALAAIDVPVAAVLGSRDRLMCHPAAGAAFIARVGGPTEVFLAPVDHGGLVSESVAWNPVIDAVEWVLSRRVR